MFEVPNTMSAKILKVNARAEHHGSEEVPAVDVKLELILPNYVLREFHSELLEAMYSTDAPWSGKQLEGVEEISEYPHLRFPSLQPLRLQDEYIGYRLEVFRGIDSDSAPTYVRMAECALSHFVIECKEGGYCVIHLNISRSDIDANTLGRLGVLTQCDVQCRLLAPVVADESEGAEEVEADEASSAE